MTSFTRLKYKGYRLQFVSLLVLKRHHFWNVQGFIYFIEFFYVIKQDTKNTFLSMNICVKNETNYSKNLRFIFLNSLIINFPIKKF